MLVFWTNRFTIKFIIDLILFYLQCDNESMLSIELEIFTWRMLSWQKMRIIENLLIMQARQLQRRDDDMKKARILLKRMRKKKISIQNISLLTKTSIRMILFFFTTFNIRMIEASITSWSIDDENRFESKKLFRRKTLIFCKNLIRSI